MNNRRLLNKNVMLILLTLIKLATRMREDKLRLINKKLEKFNSKSKILELNLITQLIKVTDQYNLKVKVSQV